MTNKSIFILALGLFLLHACQVGPKPIYYGSDGCHFCSMTIVDKQHAAQMVTHKGKGFNFDAVECMMNHLREVDAETVNLFLVSDYNAPGELVDATTATYLISEGIPSPMGGYLTAFSSDRAAKAAWNNHKGELLDWDQLKERFP